MGYYVNPPEGTKEEWLAKHGKETMLPVRVQGEENMVLVCLMWNKPVDTPTGEAFTAAAICWNDEEVWAFSEAKDKRTKKWYLVPKDKVIEVCPSVRSKF